jgi:hypothetical protein
VNCRTDLCEVLVTTRAEADPEQEIQFQDGLASLRGQPWYQQQFMTDQQFFAVMKGPGKRDLFVMYYVRR